jgi:hypothetical protein
LGGILSNDVTLRLAEAKGSAIRWAVGSPDGTRSATWRFWGNRKGDFYLAVRSLGNVLKTSLHRDGRCHTGLTNEHANYPRISDNLKGTRHWDRWALRDEPLIRAIQIVVPGSELRSFDSEEADQMVWLPLPIAGSQSVVTVYVAKRSNTQLPWNAPAGAVEPLALLATPLRSAWLIHTQHLMDDPTLSMVENYRLRIHESDFSEGVPHEVGMRAFLWGAHENSDRFFVELAFDDRR